MASDQTSIEEREKQTQQMQMREVLDEAYASLEGQRCTQSFSTFSFEDALDLQIERITGQGTRLRPNERDKVISLKLRVLKAVEALKEVPPEAFIAVIKGRDVNT